MLFYRVPVPIPTLYLKCILNAVLCYGIWVILGRLHSRGVILQDEERILCRNTQQLSILTPVQLKYTHKHSTFIIVFFSKITRENTEQPKPVLNFFDDWKKHTQMAHYHFLWFLVFFIQSTSYFTIESLEALGQPKLTLIENEKIKNGT